MMELIEKVQLLIKETRSLRNRMFWTGISGAVLWMLATTLRQEVETNTYFLIKGLGIGMTLAAVIIHNPLKNLFEWISPKEDK